MAKNVLLCATALIFYSNPVLAQTDPPPADSPVTPSAESTAPSAKGTAPSAENDAAEIIVIARRREENVQDVPIAITVLPQATLQDNNITTIGGLQQLVPSMTSTSSFFNRDSVNVAIRGQGSNRFLGPPGVVAYLNEVPIPTGFSNQLAGGPGLLFDLENVQVLKGPQGTLFGRNAAGGALLLQSARPTSAFGGAIQIGVGNYQHRELDASLNVPLVDDVLLTRVAFSAQKRDGFTHLLGSPSHPDGVDVDDRDFWSARGTVSFRPSDRVRNDLIVTYQKYDSNGSPHIITAVNPGGIFFFFPGYQQLAEAQLPLGIRTVVPSGVDSESRGSLLMINNLTSVEIAPNVTFRNIFGFAKATTVTQFDFDTTVLPVYDGVVLPFHTTTRQMTEEVQLLGDAFGGLLSWQVGGFYLKNLKPDQFEVSRQTQFGFTADSGTRNGARSYAIFAQGTYDLSALVAGLSVTAGLRQTWDRSTAISIGSDPADPTPAVCTEPRVNCDFVTRNDEKSKALTWTLGLEYRADDDTLVYLQSRRGYRPGAENGIDRFTGVEFPDVGPEYVADVELGVKSDWTVGGVRVRTNAAAYYQKYSDVQATQFFVSGLNTVSITGNVAKAELYGFELEARAHLTRNLSIGANFDYLHFEYTDFGETLLDEQQLVFSERYGRPKYKYGLSARYDLPVPDSVGKISLGADWTWQADSGHRELQIGGFIPAYGLLNLSGNWNSVGGSAMDLSVFVSNALDKDYRLGGSGFAAIYGVDFYRFGEPRMYGARLRYRFGAESRR